MIKIKKLLKSILVLPAVLVCSNSFVYGVACVLLLPYFQGTLGVQALVASYPSIAAFLLSGSFLSCMAMGLIFAVIRSVYNEVISFLGGLISKYRNKGGLPHHMSNNKVFYAMHCFLSILSLYFLVPVIYQSFFIGISIQSVLIAAAIWPLFNFIGTLMQLEKGFISKAAYAVMVTSIVFLACSGAFSFNISVLLICCFLAYFQNIILKPFFQNSDQKYFNENYLLRTVCGLILGNLFIFNSSMGAIPTMISFLIVIDSINAMYNGQQYKSINELKSFLLKAKNVLTLALKISLSGLYKAAEINLTTMGLSLPVVALSYAFLHVCMKDCISSCRVFMINNLFSQLSNENNYEIKDDKNNSNKSSFRCAKYIIDKMNQTSEKPNQRNTSRERQSLATSRMLVRLGFTSR